MTAGFVRPLHARMVRGEDVSAKVFSMFDVLPAGERTSQPGMRSGPTRHLTPEGYDEPSTGLYVYRMQRGDQEHVGLVADVLVEAFVDRRVRGHEEVQPERVAALVDLFSSDAHRSELVALLHEHGQGVATAIAAAQASTPLLDFVGPEDWAQTVWQVPDAVAGAALEEMGSSVHYVADGHHRVAASIAVWERQGRPADAAVMCVIYPPDGLRLLAFHRRVVGAVDAAQLVELAGPRFEDRPLAVPGRHEGIAVYSDGAWSDLVFRGERPPGAPGLDVALLDEHVIRPLESTTAVQVEIAPALVPIDDLVAAVDDDGGALFVLRPPSLRRLTEVADRGEVMPPKTTYFDPKPSAGIFLR
jgi:uncharacterized protein (DUF1015 family)